jgi:hypothetical protein
MTLATRAAKACARVGFGLLRMPLHFGRDEAMIVQGACDVFSGLGMLAGLVGSMYQAYGRSD